MTATGSLLPALPSPFTDRVVMAIDWLHDRYLARGEYLSDDDVLDAVDLFTTDVRADNDWDSPTPDADELRRTLFDLLTSDD